MSWLWAASGPLVEPSNRSGVHVGPHKRCTCDPTRSQDCPQCDGTARDDYLIRKAKPAERAAFRADMAAWERRRAEWAATKAAALTTDHAEEATPA
jgi:hypothetical protein